MRNAGRITEREIVHPIKVAIVVPNPCDPDYRVVKQAETLAKAGYAVRVFCVKPYGSDLPDQEWINEVEYVRHHWGPRAMMKTMISKIWPISRKRT